MNERQITVTYTLSEEQAEHLGKLTKAWNAARDTNELPSTPEEFFQFLMHAGSDFIINEKLKLVNAYIAIMQRREAEGK